MEDEGKELWNQFAARDGASMDLNDLAALIDGDVTDEERDRLEADLVRDDEALEHFIALRRESKVVSLDEFREKRRGARLVFELLATAAALVLAATVGFYAGQGGQENLSAATVAPVAFGQGLFLLEEEESEGQL